MASQIPKAIPPPGVWGSIVAPAILPETTQKDARFKASDVSLGVAVTAIMIYNIYQYCNVHYDLLAGTPAYRLVNGLDAAVPWFFVFIAFTVFLPIARSAIDGETPTGTRRFLAPQLVRIVPAYYLAVVVVWFCRQQHLPGDWRDLIEHLTFTQVFDAKRIFYTNGPAWAVSVIVLFLLLIALVNAGSGRFCRRLSSRRQRIALLALVIGSCTAGSLLWDAWSFQERHRSTTGSFTTWFGPAANLECFGCGMAIALIVATVGDAWALSVRSRALLRLAGLAILATAIELQRPDSWSGVYFSSVCAIGFGCLLAASVLKRAETVRPLQVGLTPIARLGTISYGAYLWHEPILLALPGWGGLVRQAPDAFFQDTVFVLTFSFIAGWLTRLIIEKPINNLMILTRRGDLFRRGEATSREASQLPSPSRRMTKQRTASQSPLRLVTPVSGAPRSAEDAEQ